jgi:hypothetical protein
LQHRGGDHITARTFSNSGPGVGCQHLFIVHRVDRDRNRLGFHIAVVIGHFNDKTIGAIEVSRWRIGPVACRINGRDTISRRAIQREVRRGKTIGRIGKGHGTGGGRIFIRGGRDITTEG